MSTERLNRVKENKVFITLIIMCIAFIGREFWKSHDMHIVQPMIDAAQDLRMDLYEKRYEDDIKEMKGDIRSLLLRGGIRVSHDRAPND